MAPLAAPVSVLALFKRSSFAPAFLLLRPKQRRALAALYAFARAVDDAADETPDPAEARALLDRWRGLLRAPYVAADTPDLPSAWPPLEAALSAFPIDRRHLLDLIDGVARDVDGFRAETFEDFKTYCYGVASTVGLASLAVFGLDEPSHRDFAVALGRAVQTVNILRDVRPDVLIGRIYLPREDLRRFGVEEGDLRSDNLAPAVLRLLRFEATRARAFFTEARRALPALSRRSARPALVMGALYERLLVRLEREDFAWGRPRPRLGVLEKFSAMVSGLTA
jgi:phytoene synthase